MKNMNDKQKELLFKILLVFGFVFLILTGIFGSYSNNYEHGTAEYRLYTTLGLVSIGIATVIGGVIFLSNRKSKVIT
ncbi:MAG: hypothetical protein ACM3O4_01330 [Ignavibacteriales bacterium]